MKKEYIEPEIIVIDNKKVSMVVARSGMGACKITFVDKKEIVKESK